MSNDFEDRAREDEAFDAYLQRDTEVSQRYRDLGGRSVPPALDAKVMQQAQQHSEQVRKRGQRSWLRWGAPLAVAATALIAVSVVLRPGVQEAAAPTASRAPALLSPNAAEPQSHAEENAQLSEEREDALLDSPSAPAPAAPSISRSPPAAAPPAPPGSDNAPRRLTAPLQERLRREARSTDQLKSVASAREDAKQSRAMLIERDSAVAGAPPEDRSAPQSQPPKSETAVSEAAGRAAEERKAAEPAKAKAESRQNYDEAETRNYATTGRAPTLPPAPAAPALGDPSRAAVEAASPNAELDRTIAPQVWVEWIRELRVEAKAEAAEAFLKRLRAAHPDFQLPSDLAPPVTR